MYERYTTFLFPRRGRDRFDAVTAHPGDGGQRLLPSLFGVQRGGDEAKLFLRSLLQKKTRRRLSSPFPLPPLSGRGNGSCSTGPSVAKEKGTSFFFFPSFGD